MSSAKRRRGQVDEGEAVSGGVVSFPVDSDADQELLSSAKAKTAQAKKSRSGGFESMNLLPAVYRAVKKKGYNVPTPIQRKCIPLLMAGHDVVAMARTGSGKTAAFLLPMFHRLVCHETTIGLRAIIVSPTRELALQTADFVRALSQFTDLRSCVLVGGESLDQQFSDLSANPDIVIATPGRLMQMLVEADLSLREVRYVVFDECDRLFEMGFAEQINELLTRLPETRQMALFSATLPNELISFARAGLRTPQLVRLDTDVRVSENLALAFFVCRTNEKVQALLWLLQTQLNPRTQQTIIFGATRYIVEYLSNLLSECGYESAFVFGSMDAVARKINLARFRSGKLRLLCVTDLAARGIDVPLLDNVVNFDVAARPKTFVHRVGRVARAGRSGAAYSLISTDELPVMVELFAFLGHQLKQLPLRVNTPEAAQYRLMPGVVHYGRLPQLTLDANQGVVDGAHARQPELLRVLRSSANATKLVLKSRPAASRASIKRAKLLPLTELHPLCFKDGEHDGTYSDVVLEQDRDSLITGMRNFRPRATVFELSGDKSSAVNVMMQNKRTSHQSVIAATRSRVAEQASAADDEATIQDALSAPKRNAALKKDDDDDDIDDDDDGDDEDDIFARTDFGRDDDADADDFEGADFWNKDAADDADELVDDDFEDDDEEEQYVITTNGNAHDNDDDEDEDGGEDGGDEDAGERGAPATLHKPKLSKHQRRLLRQREQPAGRAAAPVAAGRKRARPDVASSHFRDPSFYMAYTQSGASATKAYAIDAENEPKPLVKGAVPLDAVLMESGGEALAADDDKGLSRKKFVRKWDRARKRYVNVAPGVDPNDHSQTARKMKLDNGQVVKALATGKYDEWQKKFHKRIGNVGEDEKELVAHGEIEPASYKNGLAVVNGRVVSGRLRRSMPPTVIASDGDGGERAVKVGAPSTLIAKAASKGGELGKAEEVAKERQKQGFKKLMAKHGLNKARQIQLKGKLEARAAAKEKKHRKNRSTKKGYGVTTMNEFKRRFRK